ncbi:hypothetical protein J6590_027331 [Homalodisca vitripennis]|nr:hypothetical protein J6590_027331 [Homalodisca vitripennis]
MRNVYGSGGSSIGFLKIHRPITKCQQLLPDPDPEETDRDSVNNYRRREASGSRTARPGVSAAGCGDFATGYVRQFGRCSPRNSLTAAAVVENGDERN